LPRRSQSLANDSKRRLTKRKGHCRNTSRTGLDGEKARAEIEHAQETEETFGKDFNGIGLS
jgi:hypothetical protein